ncbi:MAG: GNAT family N-acetyltransferase [Phycisphaerales bacterium]|nr:GNAT family N-acetyltransferase [Phycisphaerales bacterium]
MSAPNPYVFRWLESDQDIASAFDLMHELRAELKRETFVLMVRSIESTNGYRLVGGFDHAKLISLAGVHHNNGLSRGSHLRVDDLVVTKACRGGGAGRAMLQFLAVEAKRLGIPALLLDARDEAKPFYSKLGFEYRHSTPCAVLVDQLLA